MLALVLYGLPDALVVVLVRTFLGSLFAGNISMMLYSTTAGLLSVCACRLMLLLVPRISFVAVSVTGAVLHNLVQLSVYCALAGTAQLFGYAPYLPLTLNEVGYYYLFSPEVLASSMPVFKVVEEAAAEYTPRVAQFDDMNWSKEYVEKVYAYGWMDGMGDGKFAPQGNLTIAQAVTLLARISAVQTGRVIPASEGAWYQTYLDYCMDHYLLYNVTEDINAMDDAALNAWMNQEATRMDMVQILSGAASVPSLDWGEEETVSVPDVSKDEPGGGLVYDWYRNGIVGGDAGTGAFRPDDGITRGEVAVILCNLLGL